MRVCGVEITGRRANLAVAILDEDSSIVWQELDTKYLGIDEAGSAASLRAFLESLKAFAHENGIDKFSVKQRATRGRFAGGPNSFKIEALIQLIEDTETLFVSHQALSSFMKKTTIDAPEAMPKYLIDAFYCAAIHLTRA